jgi:hypothetical protein
MTSPVRQNVTARIATAKSFFMIISPVEVGP